MHVQGRRVVVTGLGVVTPLGNDVKETWSNILKAKSGVTAIDAYDASDLTTRIYARVKNFDVSPYLDSREAKRYDIFIHYACAAAEQAVKDSGLELNAQTSTRAGVAVGSGIGGLNMIAKNEVILQKSGPRKISPFFIPGSIINLAAGMVAIKQGFRGPNISIVSACTTGTHNIGQAARMIAYGDADVMLAGGAEMSSVKLGIGGFAALRALSKRNDDPEKASRPWDKDRDGFVLGDGAGVLVLEEYESARKRGARIYAELVGFGMSCDAHHVTSPDSSGAGFIASMQNALQDAKINASEVDYINAHGTSTPVNDPLEAASIKNVFAGSLDKLSVSSTKSMIGHLLGASGAVEAVFSVLAMRDQVAPPTINLDNPEEGCDFDLVPHQAKERIINCVLSNSFGFGGTNASIVFQALDE